MEGSAPPPWHLGPYLGAVHLDRADGALLDEEANDDALPGAQEHDGLEKMFIKRAAYQLLLELGFGHFVADVASCYI